MTNKTLRALATAQSIQHRCAGAFNRIDVVATMPLPTDRARSSRMLAVVLAALFALGAPLVSAAAVTAHLDRSATTPDQPLTLSITSDTASSGAQPALAPLQQDFQVLGTSSSSETSIVNGQRSELQRWDIRLQPKHAGHLVIPSIAVGADRTAALDVEVGDSPPAQTAADAQHAFVEVDGNAATLSLYVQQQLPYTIRLFYDDSVTPTALDTPAPANAIVEQLGPDKQYTAIRRGRNYNVIERDYAIAPEKSGTLVISPPAFQGTVAVAGTPRTDPDSQDDMFGRMLADSPFANMPGMRDAFGAGAPFAQETRPITARGRQVTLNVKPRPAGAQGDWLPAEQLTLKDSWAGVEPALKVGEPITRVITIQAKGLAASQIPALHIASPANSRIYPDAPENQSRTDGQSIYGTSKQSVTYIPTQVGVVEIPAVDLAWWDVGSNVQRHATLPAFHLKASPGVATAPAAATPNATGPAATASPPAAVAHPTQARAGGASMKTIVVWGACAAVLALLLGLLVAYALSRRRSEPPDSTGRPIEPKPLPRKAETTRALRDACSANAPGKAAQALLGLASLEWPNDPPRGLDALATRLQSGAQEVLELDRCLYGKRASPWDGSALWAAVRGGLRPVCLTARPESSGLAPLYPHPAR